MLNNQKDAARQRMPKELDMQEKERVNLIQAIKDGIDATMAKDDLERVTVSQEEVKPLFASEPASKPLLHPAMASRFHRCVKDLANVLNQEDARSEASGHCKRIKQCTPKVGENDMRIDLYGDPGNNTNNLPVIERLKLSTANDNIPQAYPTK